MNIIDAAPPTLHHSLVSRRSKARLPSTDAERAAPLHVTPITRMNYHAVLQDMRAERRSRQEQLWTLLRTFRDTQHPPPRHSQAHLPQADITALLSADIIEPCSDPHPVLASAFTVVEEKHSTLRRRFILWPEELNSWIYSKGYRPQVELRNTDVHSVLEPYGGITDLTTSFFQVPLPSDLRHLFCFADSDGNIFQLTALPMGLCISPEIMQHVTATLAGDPDFSLNPLPGVHARAYIDNIQLTGPREAVIKGMEEVKSRAKAFHIQLNEDETFVGTHYTFAGVFYNHIDHTVQLGKKTHSKLLLDKLDNLTMETLERLLGRLWFAAHILDVPIHTYWWLLKNIRRRFALWSRGLVDGSSPAALSPCALRHLYSWYKIASANQPRRIVALPHSSAHFDVFTDATLQGWGAVCINRVSKYTTIVGSRWSSPAHNINAAELRAIHCAFAALRPSLQEGAHIALHIDNTSALAALRRGFARSHALNSEITTALKRLPYRIHSRYIKSGDNPADMPSRNPLYQTKWGKRTTWET